MTRRVAERLGWPAVSGMLAIALLIAAATASLSTASAAGDWRTKVDASLLSAGTTDFFVDLGRQADLSGAAALTTKEAKGRYVHQQLAATAEASQGPVLAALERHGVSSESFWVTNAVVARGGLAAIQAVATLPEVEHVYAVGSGELERPVPIDPPGGTAGANLLEAVAPGVAKTDADDVWALGFRGQGVVVAGADTGVRWTHSALKGKYRGWNGTSASHDYNWHDAIHNPDPTNVCGASSPAPCDDDTLLGGGHGTHTVGTMVGDDGGENQIGMAPDAKWIACRNMTHGVGAIPTYLECMQWFIAPTRIDGAGADPVKAPDVINNSWGCVEVCPPPALQDTLRASRAAGIFYAVSAGNDGGEAGVWVCSSIYHPLARYPEAFTVGATTWDTDSIAEFSSRGPVLLGDPPGQVLLTKPNVTAPGVTIRSALRANDDAYGNLNGTSMAGPHVAGLVALIISANPALAGNVDRIEDIIEQTAVRKTTTELCGGDSNTRIPNNTYGWGRIDALAAVRLAAPDLQVTKLEATGKRGRNKGRQGEKVTITATVSNSGGAPAAVSKTEFLLDGAQVLGLVDTAQIAPGASRTVSLVWNTRRIPGGQHQITATADRLGAVAEGNESNNSSTITYDLAGNKVKNGSFEDDGDADGEPDHWSGRSTGAGSASTTSGGSDGAKSASVTGNGGSAAVFGSPTWTSAPIAVTPGEALDLQLSVLSDGLSSPAGAGLLYLGALGNVLGRADLVTAPLESIAFSELERTVTIPAGVSHARVVLTGFAPTDIATAGTVAFDDVGLFVR
jgi:serine protease AprX